MLQQFHAGKEQVLFFVGPFFKSFASCHKTCIRFFCRSMAFHLNSLQAFLLRIRIRFLQAFLLFLFRLFLLVRLDDIQPGFCLSFCKKIKKVEKNKIKIYIFQQKNQTSSVACFDFFAQSFDFSAHNRAKLWSCVWFGVGGWW